MTSSPPSSDPVRVDIYARTDVGKIRSNNQDSFLVGDLDAGVVCDMGAPTGHEARPRGPLMVVCDGVGGVAGGEVASKLAAEVVWAEMREAQVTDERPVYARILRRAVRLANRRVFEEGQRREEIRGMGTTLSAAGLVGDAVILAQVGDSRAYVFRGSTLTQVTRDQSIVSALIHSGRITKTEARTSRQANMILQALGVREELEVSLSIVEIRRGDRLLLCSDGLHGPVGDDLIRATLASCPDLDEAVDTLIGLARKAGGPDNITAMVAHFDGAGVRPPMSEDDLPRFVEYDPMEEGERAMATTSWVARRLAAKAGIGTDPGPPVVPATGQHSVFRGEIPDAGGTDLPEYRGPATEHLEQGERLGLVAWVLAVLAALAVGAVLLWDRL